MGLKSLNSFSLPRDALEGLYICQIHFCTENYSQIFQLCSREAGTKPDAEWKLSALDVNIVQHLMKSSTSPCGHNLFGYTFSHWPTVIRK